jgi:hypothetical protein
VRDEDGDVVQSDDEDEKISRENFDLRKRVQWERIKLLSNKIKSKK